MEQRFITIKGRLVDDVGPEGLICVYAPIEGRERTTIFLEFTQFVHS